MTPTTPMNEITIAERFNGPPASANGGYTCGAIAHLLGGGPTEVRLRQPPPLERPLGWDGANLVDGDTVIAEGSPVEPADAGPPVDVASPVSVDEARAASRLYPGFEEHPFPTCFGCGPQREPGDGLRMFPGPVDGRALVAAPWTPDASLLVEGEVPLAVTWASLDCVGGWAGMGQTAGTFVLGTMRGSVDGRIEVGHTYVVTGWQAALEGRKLLCGSALWTATGDLLGSSRQTWIRIARARA